jgi:hypothetical protein
MDQNLRNKLRNVVTDCRRLLEDAVEKVLQGQFGIHATGKKEEVQVEDAARMGHLSDEDRQYREQILVHLDHIQATGFKPQAKPAKPALDQLIREIAFTHLNRLCACKMMECRGLIREAVSRGLKSQGFLMYLGTDGNEQDDAHYNAGHQDVAYRHFLSWLGGTLSRDIGVLFSPHDPANRLFPPQPVLEAVLEEINTEELKGIWTEDEAIGWVYQYFTPKDQRDEARKASAAPRNSYELAFRNQFFTPRYVVEFLTDNTLGRIWYEMRRGDTALKDRCRYLVRRPNEVFLGKGETAPAVKDAGEAELSQEALLKQPVYIPHRPKKDPRDIKVLDPACGSGHFLLYCFDLLLVVYEEAYADPDVGPTLKKDYPTLDDLRRALPGLLLSRNLHGIDIDLRATQIAALALWLRTQRAYQDMGIRKDRPKITQSNIVCAEPMPGEGDLLQGFLKTLREDKLEALIRRVMQVPADKRIRATAAMADRLCELVRLVWEKMQLAGEAGSLLKIEEELQEAIRQGQEEFEEKNPLFRVTEYSLSEEPTEHYYRLVPGDVEDERVSFWDMAERLVLAALQDYAAYAANGNLLQRQLFVEDAIRGFAFVDLCRKTFDVALMNPPFGEPSKLSRDYIEQTYPRTKNDLYAAFVERMLGIVNPGSLLGIISSRTGFFLSSFQKWRQGIILKDATLSVYADLGFGVLDTAKVETAAYCLQAGNVEQKSCLFFRLLLADNKADAIAKAVDQALALLPNCTIYIADQASFSHIPGSPLVYWVGEKVRRVFTTLPPFRSSDRLVCLGDHPSDDFRYLRLYWEVPAQPISREWKPYIKGGKYSPYYRDNLLVVDWDSARQTYRGFYGRPGRSNEKPSNYSRFFHAGITWSISPYRRGSFSHVPSGAVFSHKGAMIFVPRKDHWAYCCILNSDAFIGLLHVLMARSGTNTGQTLNYEVGYVTSVPLPVLDDAASADLNRLGYGLFTLGRASDTPNELSHVFQRPMLLHAGGATLAERIAACQASQAGVWQRYRLWQQEINDFAFDLYGLDGADRLLLQDSLDRQLPPDAGTEMNDEDEGDRQPDKNDAGRRWIMELLSYAVGCIVGRWDIGFATGVRRLPEVPDPFDPLPVCSPGMLTGFDGLPAQECPPGLPLQVEWDGILVDDPDHASDIVRRVREVLELVWKERADAIEREACEILGVKELRDYFRKPGSGGFWDDHVKRYSKSRRKAPIYWLLQSPKKNYALWLYYHRLDKDILFKALVNYVEPKIRLEDDRLKTLRTQRAGASGRDAKELDRQIEKQDAFLAELRDFEEKLRRAADLHLDPDLNDGVVLNIAPFWELVPWKEAKTYWQELLAGEYEWSSIGKQLREKGLVSIE